MSQAAPKERVRRRRVEPLHEEECRRNFAVLVELCRVAIDLHDSKRLADFEQKEIFRLTARLAFERLERLLARQSESDEVYGVPQASEK